MMIVSIWFAVSAGFVGAMVGMWFGRRSEAKYWADHADDGAVYHDGEFYIVMLQESYWEKVRTAWNTRNNV
jgi:hypothetical protein